MAIIGAGSGTGYPSVIDTTQTWSNVATPIADGPTRIDAEFANDMAVTVIALQTELGVNPSGGATTVAARLNAFLPSTSTAFTQGSIIFAGSGGIWSQDNANLKWDDTANVLLLGGSVNIGLGLTTFQGGQGVIALANAAVQPTALPTGGGFLAANGGALWWYGPSTVTQIAPA